MELIDNDKQKLLKVIKQCLTGSEKVDIAVAFVRKSGVRPLVEKISHIQNTGGQIRVLAGMNFGFTDPDALIALQNIGVQIRVFSGNTIFHPKCYIFEKEGNLKAIVGSSNLSSSGLESGIEWNVFLESEQVDLRELSLSFEKLWHSQYALKLTEDVLSRIKIIYKESQNDKIKKILKQVDYAEESIQFRFKLGKSFFNYAHHPITIPKKCWNDKLKRIKTSQDCEIIIDLEKQEKYQGSIYTSVSGFGKFYQLRFDRRTSKEVSNLFELISSIKVEIRFNNGLIQVNLDKE